MYGILLARSPNCYLVPLIFHEGFCLANIAVADPGFPVGEGVDPLGGRGPLTWVLFSENVCKNERIGFCRGACAWHAP